MTARMLVIMGSGETSPTMVTTHKRIFGRLGPPPVPAILLDTPFGFQENADDIAARAVEYYRESVGCDIAVARFRARSEIGTPAYETAMARLREARYVFAGPGSPTYALSEWQDSPVPDLLSAKIANGGAVVFASAAALTLGRVTVPVYEVYKVGLPAVWLDGLNLLHQATGLDAAVIPHYNNSEGGNHDTRFCYMGERRLRLLEDQLPAGTFVLGVDEHTGLVLDLDAGTATVVGLGVVTVRHHGDSVTIDSGTVLPIADLAAPGGGGGAGPPGLSAPLAPAAAVVRSPLMEDVARLERVFDAALAAGDGSGAAGAVLDLERTVQEWSRDTLQSDEADRARAALRSMIVRLGEQVRDPLSLIAPFVEALLAARATARADRRFEAADWLRDELVSLGVEVRDQAGGTSWELRSLR